MSRRRLAAIAAALACAAGGAALPSVGCNGTGVTPVCTFEDGAIDLEAGCGVPVEASTDSTTDSPEDQSTPVGDDSAPIDEVDASDAASSSDAADASQNAADADAGAHDAAIHDAHSDSKG